MTRYGCDHSAPDAVVVDRLINGVLMDACICDRKAALRKARERGLPLNAYKVLHISTATERRWLREGTA